MPIQTCARCGHVAGAMCPHCGSNSPSSTVTIGEFDYCLEYQGCYVRQLLDNEALEEDYGTELVSDRISAPMTPEEEEMLSADMGADTTSETPGL